MGKGTLEIEIKALHVRIENLKAQRTELTSVRWRELLTSYHELDHDKDERLPKNMGKEFMQTQNLITKLNYAIMGLQREYKDKCALLIKYIVE